jgi:hypothetical protein
VFGGIFLKSSRAGIRYPLLLYHRTMDRIWKATLALGIVVVAAASLALLKPTNMFGLSSDTWLWVAAAVAFALSGFAFISRWMAYVQAQPASLNIVTPFLRFRVSYKRMRSVRPALTQQLFPPEKSSWSLRSYLGPFYGKTALVVELRSFPLNPALLKLFLPEAMFARTTTGLVLIVADWMKLSTEIDTFRGAWLQEESVARLGRRS